jgi:hypothetical protein
LDVSFVGFLLSFRLRRIAMTLRLPDELKAMLAMMQQDVGMMVTASFFLGARLAKEAGETSKQTELLLAIANGDATLQPTGAELRQRFPGAPPDIESIRDENQKVDRIIAHVICERMATGQGR